MRPSATTNETLRLPLPVAVLRRRSHNAKSAKDQHDAAYFAWEVSLRLGVIAQGPHEDEQGRSVFAERGLGAWAASLASRGGALEDAEVRRVAAVLSEVGRGETLPPRQQTAKNLFLALPAYRNRVIGHGSVRPASFYEENGRVLLSGLRAAWHAGLFVPPQSRLAFVESVEMDASGKRKARVLDLSGEAPLVTDPRGTEVPDEVLPQRLYLRVGAAWRNLHPWLLFDFEDGRERIFVFDHVHRGKPRYLDYASGDVLSGAALDTRFPSVTEAVTGTLSGATVADGDEMPADDEHAARRFADFVLLGKLGQGGMGIVYLARQEPLSRLTALKMLPHAAAENPTSVERFRREVRALSRCEHPNIVKILSYGEHEGTHYYAMEYVEGAPLGTVARFLESSDDLTGAISSATQATREAQGEGFPELPEIPKPEPAEVPTRDRWRHLAALFAGTAEGLHHLHERGVVHRDVKPDNIVVTASDQRAVVMDLGLAHLTDATQSLTKAEGGVLGTLRYMPPEQLQMDMVAIDRRADVYSLGATLYELATNRPMFDGDTMPRLLEQVLRERPTPAQEAAPDMPRDLADILGKATAKDPKERYVTAQEFAEDMRAFADGRPISARPPTLGYLLSLTLKKHPLAAAGLTLALLAAIGGVLLFIQHLKGVGEREQRLRTEAEEHLVRAEKLNEYILNDLRLELERVGRLPVLAEAARRTKAYYDELPEEGLPWVALRGRAMAYDAVGQILIREGSPDASNQSFDKAEQILAARLAGVPDDDDARLLLATVHRHRAVALQRSATREQMRAALDRASQLLEKPSQDPRLEAKRLALRVSLFITLGDTHRQDGETEPALRHYREARQLIDTVAPLSETPAVWDEERAHVHGLLAETLYSDEQSKTAMDEARQGLVYATRFHDAYPDSAAGIGELASCQEMVARIHLREERGEAARDLLTRALGHRRALLERDPTNARRTYDVAVCLNYVAQADQLLGDAEASLARQREAVDLMQQASRMQPANANWWVSVAVARSTLAGIQLDNGNAEQAYQLFEANRVDLSDLIARGVDTPHIRYGLHHALYKQAQIFYRLKRVEPAQDKASKSLKLIEELAARPHASGEWIMAASETHYLIGMIALIAKDRAAAHAAFARALETIRPLGEQEQPSPAIVGRYAWSLLTKAEMHLEEGDLERGWPLMDRLSKLLEARTDAPDRAKLLGYIADAETKWPRK